jgi:hypothetical protein
VWITIRGRIIGQFVVCDNLSFKKLFEAEKNQIFK